MSVCSRKQRSSVRVTMSHRRTVVSPPPESARLPSGLTATRSTSCLWPAKWPVFFNEKVGVTGDLEQADFGTIKRADGKQQTTYKGMPLYFFVGDQGPGDTNGQGVAGVWSLAKP